VGVALKIAQERILMLPNPLKRLATFPKEQGGDAHCQVNNVELPNKVMFDWLEDVLPKEG